MDIIIDAYVLYNGTGIETRPSHNCLSPETNKQQQWPIEHIPWSDGVRDDVN